MAEITQNSILRISDSKTQQLIDLYHKEECLWNTKLEDYRSREKRARAAERIAKKLDIKNFKARHVMIKFKNLRNSYCQELKKIANSKNSASGDETIGIYKPKVFWFSKMDSFLRPHLQPSRGTMHHVLAQEENIKKEEEDGHDWVEISVPEDIIIPESNHLEPSVSGNDEQNPRLSKKRRYSSNPRPSKRFKMEEFELNTFRQTVKDFSSQMLSTMTRNDDYFDNFGKYIASLLRSLPPNKAMMLQPRIVELITNDFGDNEGHISQSDDRPEMKIE